MLVIAVMVASIVTYAQAAQNPGQKKGAVKEEKKEVNYCCPKCDFCDTKSGKCPTHNAELVKEGTYYCEACGTTAGKAGKCPKCSKEMKKMQCTAKKAPEKEAPKKQ